jgi:hypothetical protein
VQFYHELFKITNHTLNVHVWYIHQQRARNVNQSGIRKHWSSCWEEKCKEFLDIKKLLVLMLPFKKHPWITVFELSIISTLVQLSTLKRVESHMPWTKVSFKSYHSQLTYADKLHSPEMPWQWTKNNFVWLSDLLFKTLELPWTMLDVFLTFECCKHFLNNQKATLCTHKCQFGCNSLVFNNPNCKGSLWILTFFSGKRQLPNIDMFSTLTEHMWRTILEPTVIAVWHLCYFETLQPTRK